jgi:hypothetical protein
VIHDRSRIGRGTVVAEVPRRLRRRDLRYWEVNHTDDALRRRTYWVSRSPSCGMFRFLMRNGDGQKKCPVKNSFKNAGPQRASEWKNPTREVLMIHRRRIPPPAIARVRHRAPKFNAGTGVTSSKLLHDVNCSVTLCCTIPVHISPAQTTSAAFHNSG